MGFLNGTAESLSNRGINKSESHGPAPSRSLATFFERLPKFVANRWWKAQCFDLLAKSQQKEIRIITLLTRADGEEDTVREALDAARRFAEGG